MAKIVKVIELMSESPKSWEEAAQNVVKEATNAAEYPLGVRQRIHRGGR